MSGTADAVRTRCAAPRAVAIPPDSRIVATYDSPHLCDAYAIDLPPGTARDPEVLARFVMANEPRWIAALMRIRDALVGGFGLKTAGQLRTPGSLARIGIFRVYESTAREVVMGEDDRHLDFRASVLYRSAEAASTTPPSVIFSTVVRCHNVAGRLYLLVISPFHRLIVQAFLRRAAEVGWPREDDVRSA